MANDSSWPPPWNDPYKPDAKVEARIKSLDRTMSAEAYARELEEQTFNDFHAKKAKVEGKPPPHSGMNGTESNRQDKAPADPLIAVDLSTLAHLPLEPPTFLDGHGFIMMDAVHVLNGDGGAGKTDIICQLAIACRTNTPFLGLPVKQGPVVFYSAEEPTERIRWRIHTICDDQGLDPVAAQAGIHIIDRARKEAWLFEEKDHRLKLTPHWFELKARIQDIRPVVFMIDNRMRVLAGNQLDTVMATSVITALDGLSYDSKSAGILVSHPSMSQIANGRGDSGSVSWGNAGRGRSLLSHPDKDREYGAEDDGRRVLTNLKANYGKPGSSIDFQWKAGYFHCTYVAPKADTGMGRPDKARRVFKRLLRWHNEKHIRVSASSASPKNYGPKLFFADKKESEGVTVKEFATAMKELLESEEIVNEPYGRASNETRELRLKK